MMDPPIRLEGLQTEGRNLKSANIDQVPTVELCQIINNEDATVAAAVEKCIPVIARAIDTIADRVRRGGRLIYVGAGTSGRLGVVDASEIPPTYSAPSEQFVALMAGGDAALRFAQEGAEDDVVQAEADLEALHLDPELDSLIGIAASGRTPYVLSCLKFAKNLGCNTIGIACVHPSSMGIEGNVNHMISAVTGPEVVTGSTRMKAGTATKLALNMLSTGVMIKVGKTYGNMMVDLKATNLKLQQRSRDIVRSICGPSCSASNEELDDILTKCNGSVKVSVASISLNISAEEAANRLSKAGGVLAKVLKSSGHGNPISQSGDGNTVQEFVLAIDGGGSKCAAVMLGKDGTGGRGEAGGCNVTTSGIVASMSSISLAIQRAVDSCPTTQGRKVHDINFKRIWIGLAGYDRPAVALEADAALVKLFKRPIGNLLRVSGDVDMLVEPLANEHQLTSAIVLVAGTGSIAMSYSRAGNHFQRTGRCGGWGPVLGDDGSGYWLGREGLRSALKKIDQLNLNTLNNQESIPVDSLTAKICKMYQVDVQKGLKISLLDKVVLADNTMKESGKSSMTSRIADIARLVVEECPTNEDAKAILERGAKSLNELLLSLVQTQKSDLSTSALILTGGLMKSEIYQKMVVDKALSSGLHFKSKVLAADPARAAAQYLLRTLD